MHLRIATAAAPLPAILEAIKSTPGADRIEVRLDALWQAPPTETEAADMFEALFSASAEADQPLLMTLRPTRQGGQFDGPEDVRISLLAAAARLGAAVDLENDHPLIDKVSAVIKAEGQPIILSDHRFTEAPRTEQGLTHLQSMQDLKGARDKIAFPCGSFMDELRALELAHNHSGRFGRPCISPMGGGAGIRALLALAGNQASYGYAPNCPPAVAGQPSLLEVQAIWDHWGYDLEHVYQGAWFAVLGNPVLHSLSPRIHNAALRAAGRQERYGALEVPDSIGAMRLLTSVASRIGLKGASVTAPLKMHAADVTQGDDAVQQIGAANCIRFAAEAESTNTDGTALVRLLDGAKTVAILGAGGAARAAAWAARQVGAKATVYCRDPSKADALQALGATIAAWDDRINSDAEALVQATPMADVDAALPSQLLVELVYKDGETKLEQAAANAGVRVVSGQQFLIEQAVDAYRFWTGDAPRRLAMETVL